jgi:hypothetical protein
MSERSIYLRDQADKCRRHAGLIGDPETQVQLRKLAAEYIERAAEVENKQVDPPSVRESWTPGTGF